MRGRAFRLSTIGLPALFALIVGIGYLPASAWAQTSIWSLRQTTPRWPTQVRAQLLSDKDANANVDVVAPADPELARR